MRQRGILANWSLDSMSPQELLKATDGLIERTKAEFDKVADLKPEEVTYDNCIQALMNVELSLMVEEAPLEFAQQAVTSKELREASVEASKKLNAFSVEMAMNKQVFDNVCAFKERIGLSGLSPEVCRCIDDIIRTGKRNGLHLDEATREKVKEVKKRISDQGTVFSSNLNEDMSFLYFSEEELAGVPKDLVDSLERNDEGKCKVTLKYPHFFPVTRKCKVPETRRLIETAFLSRCMEENTKILEELVQLRQKQAEYLGYKNHAEYVLERRMAKNPEKVKVFLESLSKKLQPVWDQEREELLELKKRECEELGYEFSGRLELWDMRYYTTMIEEKKFSVDQEKLKEYFPLDKVTEGLFDIYQQLLSLKFFKCDEIDAWHPEVQLYRVEKTDGDETLGYFYLDLHPRDGKFGHAAVFPLQPGCLGLDGKMNVSLCAMMANFTKPTVSKPALLDHNEVETYFHEFGHVMHNICSQTETARLAFPKVFRDFLEAPSQMLENWVWEEETLKKMSGHYKDGSSIPAELMDKLVKSRIANAGAFNLRQIILATFDQRIHTRGEANTQAIFSDTYKEIIGLPTIENTNMPANFGHMVGYDAQYYGYLWSEVFSFDMFESKFKKEGLLNAKVGKEYRDLILKPGGSLDAEDLLRNFLGRDPNDEAFLKSKGLK